VKAAPPASRQRRRRVLFGVESERPVTRQHVSDRALEGLALQIT
jgi:hypothetical protein